MLVILTIVGLFVLYIGLEFMAFAWDGDPNATGWREPLRDKKKGRTCLRCDYDLRGLNSYRCPECGAMIGFDKSMKELGISPDELVNEKAKQETAEPPDCTLD